MVDRRAVRPDGLAAIHLDRKKAAEPAVEWRLTARTPLTLTDITGGVVPHRDGIAEGRSIYKRLAREKLHVFQAARPDGKGNETIVVGPPLTAEQVNGLLFAAAPFKGYGFDTKDIIEDWTDLYTKKEHENRKKAHEGMPGWAQFDASRMLLLDMLKKDFDEYDSFRNVHPTDVAIPVLRWQTTEDGDRRLVLEPMDDGLRFALSMALPDLVTDPARLDAGMGLTFIAAYSPDQTQWPFEDKYKPSSKGYPQEIGPTQVLAYAYRKVVESHMPLDPDLLPEPVPANHDIQQSPLLAALDTYASTGTIEPVQVPALLEQVTPRRTAVAPPNPYEEVFLQEQIIMVTDAMVQAAQEPITLVSFNQEIAAINKDKHNMKLKGMIYKKKPPQSA